MNDPHAPTGPYEPETSRLEDIRGSLLGWFEETGRDLPWRRTRDPWRVLVSEVMLQQIQVSRAIPFYESFVAAFPTVESLAAAPLAAAIRAWGDLGRYRRIVNLHRAARTITGELGGEIPTSPAALQKLPGIGPYTAGAVACFAFERDVAFADTNARRVLHRVFLGPDAPEPAVPQREVLALARRVLPGGRGWAWNQALIELGAVICTARSPACERCPIREYCAARPTIRGFLALALPPDEPAPAYEGSNRYHRGRVLAALRAAPEGLTIARLEELLLEGSNEEGSISLRAAARSLIGDGLVEVSGAEAPGDAVAEHRASYGSTAETPPNALVRLPTSSGG